MIAITLMIRAHDPSPLPEFVRHRIPRFESVARGGDQLLVWIPAVGSLLLTESRSARRIATQPAPNRVIDYYAAARCRRTFARRSTTFSREPAAASAPELSTAK